MNTTLLFYFIRNKGISRYSPKAGIQSFMIFNFLTKESKKDFGKGFDYSNVKNMRQFYLVFPIGDALRSQLRMFSAWFSILEIGLDLRFLHLKALTITQDIE